MRLLHTIDTTPNTHGIFFIVEIFHLIFEALIALASLSENCYLAFSANTSGQSGDVLIFDSNILQSVILIQAHKSPLICISFNQGGTLLATASDKVSISFE